MIFLFLILIACYLLGSVPSGYLIGKAFKGIDIRDFGSGNIGFTNVLRAIGTFPALIVLIIDITKGIVSVYLGFFFAQLMGIDYQVMGGIGGLASIVGHNWPIFLKFKGGKGVAVTAGVFLALTPIPFLLSLLVMVGIIALTRYVSLGSIVAAGSLPFFVFWLGNNAPPYFFLSIMAALFILFKHRNNIQRLLRSKESKIGEKIKA
ncbi:glycerol-3-phosphate 1-O-acyltransferase PlsY [Candidatus Aerophobetes bacterium]|uniref:Glycerol-3-phosphate acyltransferase n=1 Tax=Aerophobetes bacterium TaxID=2030807 RepID=A0A523ZK67_UNCAE|nr:MAG: glycerol-3-phosphate 1-O-acyltransferase PlsY [Candidatus Aerophobetes bacterium]